MERNSSLRFRVWGWAGQGDVGSWHWLSDPQFFGRSFRQSLIHLKRFGL